MSEVLNARADTTPVRTELRFNEVALSRWMEDHVDGFAGPLTVGQFKGGQSNPTYILSTPVRNYVLRRKPPGKLLKGAHAVEREAKVLDALGRTGFVVPKLFGLCTDDSIIGTWFYVMEMIEGRIFWDATFPEVGHSERPAYFDAMNATIAQLHGLDYHTLGLGDYGRRDNYYARQIDRWTRQYREDIEAGRDPLMERMVEWLPSNIPSSDQTTLVHGDFRCDNLIFHPTEARAIAVLDWELSTLGQPLADFANHAMMYHITPNIVAGLAGADLVQLNIPSEDAYLGQYCRRTGRSDVSGYQFALAFNLFRLAAIFHGIKGRVLRGTAVSAQATDRVRALPDLIALAWRHAERAGAQ